MAESEDDYVQRRFRDWKPDPTGWRAPDKWDRPAEFDGLMGGRGSFSLPVAVQQQPIVNGVGGANSGGGQGGDGTSFTVITNGVAATYSFLGEFV